ncbi:hypothetical protein WN51_04354 [Melipona quadrifasciata]|uniref:Uncharacterized protein n=1 Tax=Melipona quadrifasciata TaxID=166423 RepID=A0A0M8ZR89_9HYME|nr:hypothetical protein WN51_04354 [Melipona quadrifasciata]
MRNPVKLDRRGCYDNLNFVDLVDSAAASSSRSNGAVRSQIINVLGGSAPSLNRVLACNDRRESR